MPVDAMVAPGGPARPSAGPGARCAWRLLALLGLAFCAVLVFSASAHAAGCDDAACGTSPAPTRPDLLSGLLKTTGSVLHPVAARTPAEHTAVAATHSAPGTVAQAASVAILGAEHRTPVPHLLSTDHAAPVRGLLPASRDEVALPHLHDVVAPIIGDVTASVAAGLDEVADVTAPLPVVGSLVPRIGTVAAAITSSVASGVDALTIHVDAGLTGLTATIAGALTSLSSGSRLAGAGPSAPTGTGGTPTRSSAADLATPLVLAARAGVREAAYATHVGLDGAVPGVPSSPPEPDSASAVQSAPAAVALAAPASGAVGTALGSGSGPASAGSSGPHEQAEAPRSFPFRAVLMIGRPGVAHAGPMPSTPLVDPGFSPD